MHGKVLFFVSTNFNLLNVKLLMDKFNIKTASIISNAINTEINEIILSDDSFVKVLKIDRDDKGTPIILRGFNNKKRLQDIQKFMRYDSYDYVVVFKDKGLLNEKVIELAKNKNSSVILVEEGIAIYTNSSNPNRKKNSFIKRNFLSYPEYNHEVQGTNPLVDQILVSSPENLPIEKQHGKKIDKLRFNGIGNSIGKELFSYFSNGNKTPGFKENKPVVLFLGQPFSELGMVSIEKELNALETIIKIIRLKKLCLLIKPHPSEDINKYSRFLNMHDIKIINNNHIPSEIIPLKYEVEFVITAYSSSIQYIKNWYSIEALSIINLYFPSDSLIEIKSKLKEVYQCKIIGEKNCCYEKELIDTIDCFLGK